MHERITAQTTTDIIETVNEHRHTTETHTLADSCDFTLISPSLWACAFVCLFVYEFSY